MQNTSMSEAPIAKKDLIKLRSGTLDDINLVFSSWLDGLRFGNWVYGLIDKAVYYQTQHKVIEYLLARPTVSVRVACLADAPDVIIGYSVFENNKLHWIYVKKKWRGIGVARDLMPYNIDTVTNITNVGLVIMRAKLPHVRFNPFL